MAWMVQFKDGLQTKKRSQALSSVPWCLMHPDFSLHMHMHEQAWGTKKKAPTPPERRKQKNNVPVRTDSVIGSG